MIATKQQQLTISISTINDTDYFGKVINVLYSNCQSSFFMVHNLKKNEYYCITNSTHALSWLADEKGTQESETGK
jgi:hypothetical protein